MYSPITGFHKAIVVTTNDDIIVLRGEEKNKDRNKEILNKDGFKTMIVFFWRWFLSFKVGILALRFRYFVADLGLVGKKAHTFKTH